MYIIHIYTGHCVYIYILLIDACLGVLVPIYTKSKYNDNVQVVIIWVMLYIIIIMDKREIKIVHKIIHKRVL